MIYAGVDIAKADHVIGAVGETGEEAAKPMPFKNSKEGFERCVAWLEGVAETQDEVVVGMEATGHYWQACFSYLTSCGYRVAVINPMQVRAVRKLKSLSKVKNDRIDSVVIAETLRIGSFDETALATDELQSLKTLTRYRQSLKEQVAAVKTHVVCLMDTYFPRIRRHLLRHVREGIACSACQVPPPGRHSPCAHLDAGEGHPASLARQRRRRAGRQDQGAGPGIHRLLTRLRGCVIRGQVLHLADRVPA